VDRLSFLLPGYEKNVATPSCGSGTALFQLHTSRRLCLVS
jgi:hypothetical protein